MEEAVRRSTGIAGLDELLDGGLIPQRTYLVRGGPGTGKTILGLHFLTARERIDEPALFINLGEPELQIRQHAERLGFDLRGITFLDLTPDPTFFTQSQNYDIFSPAEVEREPTTQAIIEHVERLRPLRVVVDSMTHLRYLSTDTFQFRKQVLAFLRFLVQQKATVVFTSETSSDTPDDELQSMSDGVIHLQFGPNGRSISVTKFRGSDFRSGEHAMRLSSTGVVAFPRLLPASHQQAFAAESISSGVPELDELLHGGFERGTVTIISGPSGVGKTTIGLLFMKEAAGRGEHSAVYSFEESTDTLLRRCEAINIPARTMIARGTLTVTQIEPLLLTPDEFASLVRQEVEERQASILMIDSTAGYRLAMRGDDLVTHLHALCRYLKNMGVTIILVNEVETISGDFRATEIGISYLADNIVFMRYMERDVEGHVEICKAIGVLKKRLTDFERTLREVQITRYGIKIGRPMPHLRGILSSMPQAFENGIEQQ